MGIKSEDFRINLEKMEEQLLSPYAARASESRGRERQMEGCPVRTAFMRDRDRIIHCKSFRRLKHKTQVFLSPVGDHYRTRLTHTLEVNQIARTITRGLRLNEDLTEAIALGHDLGHTPFGHAGEYVLDELVPGGFEHNVQSLRVVEKLENNGNGLNLTFEVRDGILNHKQDGMPITLEGQVVSIADRIAYINHDIDDAIRAGVLEIKDIPQSCNEYMGSSHGERINSLICDILSESFGKPEIAMSDGMAAQFTLLRDFMFQRVYLNSEAKREEEKGKHVIAELYRYYLEHVDALPSEFTKYIASDGPEQVAADYIACMSDRYAITDYTRLFVPTGWV